MERDVVESISRGLSEADANKFWLYMTEKRSGGDDLDRVCRSPKSKQMALKPTKEWHPLSYEEHSLTTSPPLKRNALLADVVSRAICETLFSISLFRTRPKNKWKYAKHRATRVIDSPEINLESPRSDAFSRSFKLRDLVLDFRF
jgi:hypothetical protein